MQKSVRGITGVFFVFLFAHVKKSLYLCTRKGF